MVEPNNRDAMREEEEKKNKKRNIAIGVGAGVVTGLVILPLALTGLGLGAAGPVAGGVFATIQSWFGGIAAGGALATA